jgi:hypothetical protein
MRINFDLANKEATFEHNGECVYSDICVIRAQQWMSAVVSNVSIGVETYSFAWKTCFKQQNVEVCTYDARDKIPCKIVAAWSYRSECPIEHYGLEGCVTVTGSPYGNWCN